MDQIGKLTALIAISMITLSCVSNKPLSKEILSQSTSADSVLFIAQNNINVIIEKNQTYHRNIYSSLLSSGLNAVAQDIANKEAAPILAALKDFDFRSTAREALSVELSNAQSLQFSDKHSIESIASNSQKLISYQNAISDTVLFVTLSYELLNTNLTIKAIAQLYSKIDRLNSLKANKDSQAPLGEMSHIYKNEFEYTYYAINVDNVKIALEEGAQSLAKQIVADLNRTE